MQWEESKELRWQNEGLSSSVHKKFCFIWLYFLKKGHNTVILFC